MTLTAEGFDVFLLILVRISAFVYAAPFFSLRNIPQKVKAGFSLFFSLIIFQVIPTPVLEYQSVIDFALLLLNEAMVGLIIGFFTNISYYILAFAGNIVDMDIGFSMVNELDPSTNIQTTITSNFYSYLVMLMMLITNMHHYIIKAFADAFTIIPVGKAIIQPDIYLLMSKFMKDYFIIGFRIVLPVFASVLLLNSILAILAKIAPQMNMFVIGMQLKVMIGLIVLFLLVVFIPNISEFIFNEMMEMMKAAIKAMS
jgi:flagellar biosynthetic protein FliR